MEYYVFLKISIGANDAATVKSFLGLAQDYILTNCDLLHLAVPNANVEIFQMLLDRGVSINYKNSNGSPLCLALKMKKFRIAEILLNHNADVNIADENNSTPLHIAAEFKSTTDAQEKKREKLVNLLLTKGADINAKTKKGLTALHLACLASNLEMVKLLLQNSADISAKSEKGNTPLHLACRKDNAEIVQFLLDSGADINAKTHRLQTSLHLACQKNNVEIVQFLLDSGADINARTHRHQTPLHFACNRDNKALVRLLLKNGADINTRMEGGITPLLLAAYSESSGVVDFFLRHGARVDDEDDSGKTALHWAVYRGNLQIVETLLKYKPDIDNPINRNCLKKAVYSDKADSEKILSALLGYGLTVDVAMAKNSNFVHVAVEKGYVAIVGDLLKCGANVNTACSLHVELFSLLHSAVKNKHYPLAELLISNEADVNAQDKNGKPPIFYSIDNVDLKMTQLLLSGGTNVKDHPDLLFNAVRKNSTEIVDALLLHGADINASDEFGRTALHMVVFGEHEGRSVIKLSAFFLKKYDDANVEVAQFLLSKGANVDAQTKSGVATLHASIYKSFDSMVEILLKFNANVNITDEEGSTPLHIAACRGNVKIIPMLLKKGANVNKKMKNGSTALHIAVKYNHEEVVKLLLQSGANVNCKGPLCITPLHVAAEIGNSAIVDVLLSFGACADARIKDGRTELYLAAGKGAAGIVASLIEYGADINIEFNSRTPLSYACVNLLNAVKPRSSYYGRGCEYPYRPDETAYLLDRHRVKMIAIGSSKRDQLSVSSREDFSECQLEVLRMKGEFIEDTNVSYYDITTRHSRCLAKYMKNKRIVLTSESEDYKRKFPIYACVITGQFRKGLTRIKLLEEANRVFLRICKLGLPEDCVEQIFEYVRDEDLSALIDIYE